MPKRLGVILQLLLHAWPLKRGILTVIIFEALPNLHFLEPTNNPCTSLYGISGYTTVLPVVILYRIYGHISRACRCLESTVILKVVLYTATLLATLIGKVSHVGTKLFKLLKIVDKSTISGGA